MKTTTNILLIAIAFFLFIACNSQPSGNEEQASTPAETEEVAEKTMSADATSSSRLYDMAVGQSIITWKGTKKLVEKVHTGTIDFTQGYFEAKGDILTGGEFVVDMTSIKNEDMAGTEGAAKLEGHLKSADFFDVAVHSTASFVITSSELSDADGATHNVTGKLTIKGITDEISFPATVTIEGDQVDASASFTIDRAQYDVQYGSEAFFPNLIKQGKDAIISDEIELTLNLSGQARAN